MIRANIAAELELRDPIGSQPSFIEFDDMSCDDLPKEAWDCISNLTVLVIQPSFENVILWEGLNGFVFLDRKRPELLRVAQISCRHRGRCHQSR